jgi:multiple sugar transport system ATP-binding protein
VNVGDPVTLGIRPEHISFGDTLAARVLNVERFGDSSLLYLECTEAKEPLTMRTDGGTRLKRGDSVSLALPEQHVHMFDAQERALTRSVDPLSE